MNRGAFKFGEGSRQTLKHSKLFALNGNAKSSVHVYLSRTTCSDCLCVFAKARCELKANEKHLCMFVFACYFDREGTEKGERKVQSERDAITLDRH